MLRPACRAMAAAAKANGFEVWTVKSTVVSYGIKIKHMKMYIEQIWDGHPTSKTTVEFKL